MFPLQNKVALISGGLGGIGLGLTQELLENGLKVFVIDINSENWANISKDFEREYGHGKIAFLEVDITQEDEVESKLTLCGKKLNKIF